MPRPKKPCTTNWNLCVLCQDDTTAALECPAKSKRAVVRSGYKSLAKHLIQFQSLGHMPMAIDVRRIDDGDGFEATMTRHQASWHKTCRLKFNQTKFDRLNEKFLQEKDSQGIQTRSTHETVDLKDAICIFCDQPAGSEGLHNASTYEIDKRVRQYALDLQDTVLLTKLAAGDMIAIEAKYHKSCLTALCNKARAVAGSTSGSNQHNNLDSIALAELVAYMEDCRNETDIAPVFKLTDLAQLYKARLEQLGVEVDGRVHTSRLKLRLLAVLPNLKATSQGKNVMLSFDDDIGGALQKACDHDYYSDSDAMHLVRAAKIVRKQMFLQKYSFNGSFSEEHQENVVPQSLLALVNMILEGPNIKHQSQLINATDKTASNSICQLMVFNSVKNAQNMNSSAHAHQKHMYEMPVPLYITMKIHAVTRSKNLIDTLFSLGICVSYDRFLRLTSEISSALCEKFNNDGVVCPPKLRSSLFTTAAVDNIDYNPSSATAKDSFHGTGISIIKHPSHAFQGHRNDGLVLNQNSTSFSVATLPSMYTNVPPASIKSKEFKAPMVDGLVMPTTFQTVAAAKEAEVEWLQTLMAASLKHQLDETDWISWSAYHSSVQEATVPPSAINTLLPLFLDNAHSIAMIKHSMNIVKAVVRHLNPGQAPVLTADQPLFALAKQIQWTWPDPLGENHFVVMLGGLHFRNGHFKGI